MSARHDCIGTFEIDSKTIDLNSFINGVSPEHRVRGNFVWIGILIVDSPRKIEMQRYSDGRMKSTPPRLNGLHLRQHSFWKLTDPIVWNYVVDNGLEQGNEVEDSSNEDDESVVVVSSPSEVSPPSSSVAGASITPVKSATPVDKNISTKYPHLSRALGDDNGHFDPADPSVQTSLQGLLQEINHLLSSEYELNVRAISSNKPISYVCVPRTKSDNAFTNSKEWLDTAINVSGSPHRGTFESAYWITNHLIKIYKDSFIAACKTQGVPVIIPMSATQFQAMLHTGKVTATGEQELKKHLSSHLGKGFFPT